MGAWHAVVNVCFRRGCRLFALDRCALRCDTSTLYPRPIDRSSRRTAGIGALDASRCERMTDRRRLLLIAVIAFLAAIAGAFIGRAFIAAPAPVENELHSLLHHNLKLDRAQQTPMDEIERDRKSTRLNSSH